MTLAKERNEDKRKAWHTYTIKNGLVSLVGDTTDDEGNTLIPNDGNLSTNEVGQQNTIT